MTRYAGLDVSDKLTHVCIVDATGAVLSRAGVASDPEVLAHWLKRYARDVERVVLFPVTVHSSHTLAPRRALCRDRDQAQAAASGLYSRAGPTWTVHLRPRPAPRRLLARNC
jgi:hypothetical protein